MNDSVNGEDVVVKKRILKNSLILFFVTATVTIFSSCDYLVKDKNNKSSIAQKIVKSKSIADFLGYVDKDTLAIFDCDNTLVENAFEFICAEWFNDKTKRLQAKGLNYSEIYDRLEKVIDFFPKVKPVEKETSSVLNQILNRNVKVLILTGRRFKYADITLKQINSIGVSFEGKEIYDKKIDFGNQVGFSRGILFSADRPKGEVLFLFLDKIGFSPKRIVVLDDSMKNVQSIYDKLVERAVAGVCIHYVPTQTNCIKFDPARADKAFRKEFKKHGYDIAIYENVF
jgi:hypothetical protein